MYLALSIVAMLFAATSCSYDDGAVWDKFEELESDIEQNRADIETLTQLMDALSGGKVIVATEATDEGIVLTFSDGSQVTIRNGKDGANGKDGEAGEDGKDGATEVIITLTDGRVIRLPKARSEGDSEGEGDTYTLRTLSFEDADAQFTGYTLYGGAEINTWSDLIDDMQYGGSLTYTDYMNDVYYWYDEGNTELYHAFATPYWGGGHVISNYVIEDYSTLPEGHYGWQIP